MFKRSDDNSVKSEEKNILRYDKEFFTKLTWIKLDVNWTSSFSVGLFHIKIIIERHTSQNDKESFYTNFTKLDELDNIRVKIYLRRTVVKNTIPNGFDDTVNYFKTLPFSYRFSYGVNSVEANLNLNELIKLCNVLKVKLETVNLMT